MSNMKRMSNAQRTTGVRIVVAIGCLLLFLYGYTQLMAKLGSGVPSEPAPVNQQADQIVVHKAERLLLLLRKGEVLARYPIVMGKAAAMGPKSRDGDKKTPEGNYIIDWRNSHSRFSLSLHISYPDSQDRQRAEAAGNKTGGNVMIHGSPNGWQWLEPLFRRLDWTDGCIAVTNTALRDIWSRVPVGTPIRIEP